jgi:uncharacterized protein (TIGR03118 family)
LASDVPGLARVIDPNLANPWGIAFSPTGPFWFADNGSGVSDLLDGRGQPVPLVVPVPSAVGSGGTPTGVVFNGGAGFTISENGVSAPSRFLFATQDGTISGWTSVVDPTRALPVVDNSSAGAVYTGLALAADPTGRSFLYAADFSHGTIDVFDQDFRPVVRPGSFQDASLPTRFAPFNIQKINNLLFVAYARQDEDGREDVAGTGHGFLDVYDTTGRLVRRFASQGSLNSPWGLALAPADFGPFGGALLVGNNGDGRINAYNPRSGTFLGELADDNGTPITIPNLWALTFGNGHAGGDPDTLFFAAGVGYDEHGLFGAIQAAERRGADTAGSGAFDPSAPGETGDYPLPPSSGPALRTSGADQSTLIADLLPFQESSLALVPTLSLAPQPSLTTRPSVPMGSVSSSGSVLTGSPVFTTTLSTAAEGNYPPARGVYSNVVALNTFLDLSASQQPPEESAGVQRSGFSPHPVGARTLTSAERDFGGQVSPPEVYIERLDAQLSKEPGPAPPPLSQATKSALSKQSVETPHRNGWTNLMRLLFIGSLPMVCTSWARHHDRSVSRSRAMPRP